MPLIVDIVATQLVAGLGGDSGGRAVTTFASAPLQAAPAAVKAPVGLLERRRRANPREQHTGDSDIDDDRAYD